VNKSLREIFLERVIKIDAVQSELVGNMAIARDIHGRETKLGYPESFFDHGLTPGAENALWSVRSAPAPVFPEALRG
jgi:hypothetical protein